MPIIAYIHGSSQAVAIIKVQHEEPGTPSLPLNPNAKYMVRKYGTLDQPTAVWGRELTGAHEEN